MVITARNAPNQGYKGQLNLDLPIAPEAYASPDDLLPETRAILEYACEVSDKDILIVPEAMPGAYASVRLAHDHEPFHLVGYDPGCGIHPEYLIGHECGHIIRAFSVPPQDRTMPEFGAAGYQTALAANWQEISRCIQAGASQTRLAARVKALYFSIVQRLISNPADVHIEHWLRQTYPGLNELQKAGLERGVAAHSYRRPRRVPNRLLMTDRTLSYAVAQELGDLIGNTDLAAPMAKLANDEQAQGLRRILHQVGDQGHPGDVETADRWAEYLGLRGWFQWQSYQAAGCE
jgi:hypothetical protein